MWGVGDVAYLGGIKGRIEKTFPVFDKLYIRWVSDNGFYSYDVEPYKLTKEP